MVMLCCFHMEADCVTDEEFWDLAAVVSGLQAENEQLRAEVDRLTDIIERATDSGKELLLNLTIEERVAVLETQVVEIEEDVTGLGVDLVELEGDVDFLFDETVIQDERLFSLEEDSDALNEEVEVLEDTAAQLDFRVTTLEESGGSGNSSIAELEVRVETLEVTVSDQETRLTSAESQLKDLQNVSDELETRLTTTEENIQGLQETDMNHDARISALEENGGGGFQNDTIAFHSALTSYSTIPIGSTVIFNEVLLNEGDGYDSTTGVFTVPPGGDGVYYFSIFVRVESGETGGFSIKLNDDVICTTYPDHNSNGDLDYAPGSCTAVVVLIAGDEVQVEYVGGTDDTPVQDSTTSLHNGFNGFRI